MNLRGGSLLEFRQAVDDARPQVVSKLDLDHLRSEILPNPSDVFGGELQLSSTSFDQVIEEQRQQMVSVLVAGKLPESS